MIKDILSRIRKNEFWGSVAKLSAGQLIAQIVTLLITPVLSRIYSNADYGTMGIITSTSALLMTFTSLALGSAVMIAKTDDDSKRVFSVAYSFQALLTVIIIIAVLVIQEHYQIFKTTFSYNLAVLLMGIHILANTLNTMLRIYINKKKMNNTLFINSLITAGANVFIAVPLGLLKFGFWGLFITSLVAEIASSVQMVIKANPFVKYNIKTDVILTLKECKRFILFQYPANLMSSVTQNAPQQTLYHIYSEEALGSYSMCNKLFRMPLNLIVTPIQTIYFRTAVEMSSDRNKLADFSFNFFKKFSIVAVIPMIILMSFGEYIFGLVLGPQWREAGTIASIMTLYFFFFFCYSNMTYLRIAIEKQKVNFYMTIVRLAIVGTAIIISLSFKLSMLSTVSIFAISNTLINFLDLGINFICLKRNVAKYFGYSFLLFAFTIIPTLVIRHFIY